MIDYPNLSRQRKHGKRIRITPPNEPLTADWLGADTNDQWNAAHGWPVEN